jgi:hypothetical protein
VEANEASLVMAAAAFCLLNHPRYHHHHHEDTPPGQPPPPPPLRDVIHPFLLDALTNEVDAQRRYDGVFFPDQPTNMTWPASSNRVTTTVAAAAAAAGDENNQPDNNSTLHQRPNIGVGSLSYTIGDFAVDHVVATTAATCHNSSCDGGNYYSAVVTCFFIDTATNIYDHVAILHRLLVPDGGIWINVGPLQWHRNSILPIAADELRDVMQIMGFDILYWSVDQVPLEYRQHEVPPQHHAAGGGGGGEGPRWTNFDAYRPLRFVARRRRRRK